MAELSGMQVAACNSPIVPLRISTFGCFMATMMTTHELADLLTRGEIARRLGVHRSAVSNAVVRGRFPSSWYCECRRMAAERGVECPEGLFGMRASSDGGPAPRAPQRQGRENPTRPGAAA